MPRGSKRALGAADPITEARRDRALQLADLLAILQTTDDPRLATGAGRLLIAQEAGLSEGEYRRRLADARQLLATQNTPEAQAIFSFGPRTVLIEGARYRTRGVRPGEIVPGRLYAVITDGEVTSTFAGDVLQVGPPGSSSFWRLVRRFISQGLGSSDAISYAAGQVEEQQYIEETLQNTRPDIVELIGSSYPADIPEDTYATVQSSFVD
jgi:hypothetical protein